MRYWNMLSKKSTILYQPQLASWETKKGDAYMYDGLVGEGSRARRSSVSETKLVGETKG